VDDKGAETSVAGETLPLSNTFEPDLKRSTKQSFDNRKMFATLQG
jgi:hypothetical protein